MKHNWIRATAGITAYVVLFGLAGFAPIALSAQALPTPQAMESPMPVNVITNNPNGPNWLQAFDRKPAMNHGMMMDHGMTMQDCMIMQHRMMMKHKMMMQHPRPMPTASPKR